MCIRPFIIQRRTARERGNWGDEENNRNQKKKEIDTTPKRGTFVFFCRERVCVCFFLVVPCRKIQVQPRSSYRRRQKEKKKGGRNDMFSFVPNGMCE
jgi:hypothetical protein